MSEQKESIDFGPLINFWRNVNKPLVPQPPLLQPVLPVSFVSQLNESSLAAIRQIIREEIETHDQRGLDRLMADIHRTEPLPEDEEIAAYLVTLSIEEWNALIEKVNERRYRE